MPARIAGLGSVFGKTIRDGRRGGLLVGGFAGMMMLITAAALNSQWPTPALRAELLASMDLLPPVVRGLLGDPIAIDTLGGFLSWRIGNLLPVMLGAWSVLALSGTLAAEARKGSLDVVAATPISRRRLALEKVFAHVALVVAAMLIASLITWVVGRALATVPVDDITIVAALGHFTLTGLLILAAGSLAFAAAPIVGRGKAAGLGFVALFGGYVILAYRSIASALDTASPLSWYAWTADHRPLAGRWDWAPVGAVAVTVIVLIAVGVVAFERRDIGVSVSFGRRLLPGLPVGTRRPFARQLADRAGVAIVAGLGIGLYGAMIGASAREFAAALSQMPGIDQLIEQLYPGIDVLTPPGLLQLAFFAFGALLVAFAAAGFVSGWASDETGRRLDFVLGTSTSRLRWYLETALGVFAAVGLTVAIAVSLIALGVASAGGDIRGLPGGAAVLALYGMAVASVGLAVGGLGRPGLAAGATALVAIGSYLLSLLGNFLGLPEWIVDLSLNEHVGTPLAGNFDVAGLGIMGGLVVLGIAVGAWRFRTRDLST